MAGNLRFSAAKYSASETGAVAVVTVQRNGGRAGGVTVEYATADGTATNGVDYTESSGTLTFDENETSRTFTVPILNNTAPDGNKTVLLSLRDAGGGGRLVAPTNAVLTILDDESSVQFASAAYTVSESKSAVAVTLVRSGAAATAFTVTYATTNGTATAGADYTAKTGTVSFGAGVLTKTITIPLRGDSIVEGNETFRLRLGVPTGGVQPGPRGTTEVTIVDND